MSLGDPCNDGSRPLLDLLARLDIIPPFPYQSQDQDIPFGWDGLLIAPFAILSSDPL